MVMIILNPGQPACCVESSSFPKEAAMQEYISKNPECLPVDDINENARLLVVAREVSTSSRRIDLLGIDADGASGPAGPSA